MYEVNFFYLLESKIYLEKISKNINKDGTIIINKKDNNKVKKLKRKSANEEAHLKYKTKMRAQSKTVLEKKLSELLPICGKLNYLCNLNFKLLTLKKICFYKKVTNNSSFKYLINFFNKQIHKIFTDNIIANEDNKNDNTKNKCAANEKKLTVPVKG